jgi:hypothetical protein
VKACVVAYLEELRSEEASVRDALQRSVVSSFLGKTHRKTLEGRLEVTKKDWIERDVRFEVLEEKHGEDLGAVLVAARSEYDPLSVEVLAMGVQQKKGEWRSAPLPGGFEAVFLGFEDEVEKRVADLERWMSGERARLMQALRLEAQNHFREALLEAAPAFLSGEDPEAVVTGFMALCRKRDFLASLSCLGEMDEEPDRHWLESKAMLEKGLRGSDRRKQWRLLRDPVVFSFIAEKDVGVGEAEVTVLFYDPAEGSVRNLAFELARVEERWVLSLPRELRHADVGVGRFFDLTHFDPDDEDLEWKQFEEFQTRFEGLYPSLPGTTVDEVGRNLSSALGANSVAALFRMLSREVTLQPRERILMYRGAAKLWMLFRGQNHEQDPKVVGVKQREEAGVLAVARLDVTKLNWVQLAPVHLMKKKEQWLISPGVVEPGNFKQASESLVKDQWAVHKEHKRSLEEYREKALPSLLGVVGALGDLTLAASEEEPAVALVKKFRKLLRENKPLEALECCVLADQKKGIWEGMRVMTYTARGSRQAREEDEFLLTRKSGPWTAVSVRVSAPEHGTPHYTMYLIAPTEGGPRVVVDIDLRLATNKGRTLLNEESLKRLSKELNEEHLDLVKGLFQEHIKKSQRHYEEWQKSTKSSP